MSKPIDYASPTHELTDICFDVKLQMVFSEFRFPATLFNLPVSTDSYRAVVNQTDGQILSIVGSKYQLISNKTAIEMGKEIFVQLYPSVKADELIPYKIVAPKSKASAHIDLIHKNVNFNVYEQESWLPFLRISNSYNRSYALAFEIGFVRKLCSNGVLFNKKTMKLKYLHNNSNKIEVKTDASQIESASEFFSGQCRSLRDYEIPQKLMFALICQILHINLELPEKGQVTKKTNSLQNLIGLTQVLTSRYCNEVGSNAYAAFNVVTDLVSHQDEYKNLTGFYFSVRSYYTKPTDWIEEFTNKKADKNFVYTDYLKSTIDHLNRIKENLQLEWELN